MKQEDIDEKYMRRCLQLARNGQLLAKPNPMVGAVIVSKEGKIIGEGYHVRCGKGHAEVNAFASVRLCSMKQQSTLVLNHALIMARLLLVPTLSSVRECAVSYVVASTPLPKCMEEGLRNCAKQG